MTKPGPSVTSGADTQPGSDSLFPSGFGGGSLIRAGGVGTSEIADSSVAAADLNLPSVAAALAARGEFTGTYATFKSLARTPDALITGAVTRDANGAATSATVTWPDGTTGTYTATTVSTAFPGAVDAYTITYGSPATRTYTQAAVTRDVTTGAATNVPAIVVS